MILPKALIFDVDGTLADNERDGHRVAFNQAFDDAGLDWCWSENFYGALLEVGGGKERIRHYIESSGAAVPAGVTSETELSQFIAGLHRTKTALYCQRLAKGLIPLRPGVLRLLMEARAAGVRLAIATTSALPNAMLLVEQMLPAGDWFEVIVAGDMVAKKKPAPDVYRYALAEMGLAAEDCLAIEDSPVGMRAAIAAGLKTVVTVNGYTEGGDFAGASLVVNNLGEPERPFTVLAGEAGESSYVDLALLKRVYAG